MIAKSLFTFTSVGFAGISIWWALRKYRKFSTDQKEDGNSPSNSENELKSVNDDNISTALASKDHVQIEQDFKLAIVTPMQSDIEKNPQAVESSDIHPNPPYNCDNESSLIHTEKVISKWLGESPLADVPASVEHPLGPVEPAPEQSILIEGVKEELMVPKKKLKEKLVQDIETEEVSPMYVTITSPVAEKEEIIELAKLSSSLLLDSQTPYNSAKPVDTIIGPMPTIVVEPLWDVEPDVGEKEKSNFLEMPSLVAGPIMEPMVPEKHLEETPVPDNEIEEPSQVSVTVLSPVAENEENIKVAKNSSSPVLHSKIPYKPVTPVDPIVGPVPTIVIESLQHPETSVASPEASKTKQQITNVEPCIEEKEKSNVLEQLSLVNDVTEEIMVTEKQFEEKPVPQIEIGNLSPEYIVTLPIAGNDEIIEVAEVSCSPVLEPEILSNTVMPVDPTVVPLPTIVVEPPPVPETSVVTPDMPTTKLQSANVEPDLEEKKKSNFLEEPSLVTGPIKEPMVPEKQLEEKSVPDVEIEEPSLVSATVLSSVVENEEIIINMAEESSSQVLDSEFLSDPVTPIDHIVLPLPTVVVDPTPVPETSVAAPEVSNAKIKSTYVEADVEEKNKSTSPVLDSEIRSNPIMLANSINVPLPTIVVEPPPFPETSVAAPEVSVTKIKSTDVEADVEEKNKSTSPVLDSEIRSNPIMLTDSIVVPLPTIVVEPPPFPKISVAAPKMLITKPQSTNVEPDSEEKKKSNFLEEPSLVTGPIKDPMVPEKQLEEKPVPDVEIEEPSLVSSPDLSAVLENEEIIEVAEESSSQVLDSEFLSDPVFPVDDIVAPLPTIVVEPSPVPETYVAAPEASITKIKTTDVDADVEEKKKSTSPVLDSEIQSNAVMLADSIAAHLPTIVAEPFLSPKTSIASPEVSNLGVTKDGSGSLLQAMYSGQRGDGSRKLSSESNLEAWNPLYRIFTESNKGEAISFGGPILRFFESLPAVETFPVPETSVAPPEVSSLANVSKKNSSKSNLDTWDLLYRMVKEETICFGGPMLPFFESALNVETFPVPETSVAVPKVSNPTLQSANVEPDKQEDKCQINRQTWFAVPETSVAVPEVPIPTPQSSKVQPDKPEDMHQKYWQNLLPVPKTSVVAPEVSHLANATKINSYKSILYPKNKLYRIFTESNTEKAICFGGPMLRFFESLSAVETFPVTEKSVAAPKVSNLSNVSKNKSSKLILDAQNPLYRVLTESNKAICFGGSTLRFSYSLSAVETIKVPGTSVAAPEVSNSANVSKPQTANIEPDKQEYKCQINWENWFSVPETSVAVPEAPIPTPKSANVEPDKPQDMHLMYRQNWLPVPETSLIAPGVSHLANTTKINLYK